MNQQQNVFNSQNRMKQLLEEIKSGDDVRIMDAVIKLSSELSLAQDNSISQYNSEQFIPPLVECLNKHALPEIVC